MSTTRTIPAWGTKIEWCDATVNFWEGCSKVSSGCAHCYAAERDRRWHGGAHWGKGAARKPGKGAVAKALALDARAKKMGKRLRVFTNSLADIFDVEVPDAWRDTAHAVFALTPNLDWILVTKRPEVAEHYYAAPDLYDRVLRAADPIRQRFGRRRLCSIGINNPALAAFNRNRWLLVSVEDQDAADERVPIALHLPFAVIGVSVEPMLGPVDLRRVGDFDGVNFIDALAGLAYIDGRNEPVEIPRLGWVIVGSESGLNARPMVVEWADEVRRQCNRAGVACFVKQLGAQPVTTNANLLDWPDETDWSAWGDCAASARAVLRDRKGGDWSEWPEELRVRQFPEVAR